MNPSIVPSQSSNPLPTSPTLPDSRWQALLTEIAERTSCALSTTLGTFIRTTPNVPFDLCERVFFDIVEGRLTLLAADGSGKPNLADRLKVIELASLTDPDFEVGEDTDDAESVPVPEHGPSDEQIDREVKRLAPAMRGASAAQIRLTAIKRLKLIAFIVGQRAKNSDPLTWALRYVRGYVTDEDALKFWFVLVKNYAMGDLTPRDIAEAIPTPLRHTMGSHCAAAAMPPSQTAQTAQDADRVAAARRSPTY